MEHREDFFKMAMNLQSKHGVNLKMQPELALENVPVWFYLLLHNLNWNQVIF
jgi:hypothetical protein